MYNQILGDLWGKCNELYRQYMVVNVGETEREREKKIAQSRIDCLTNKRESDTFLNL